MTLTKMELQTLYNEFQQSFLTVQVENMDQAMQFVGYLKVIGYKPVQLKIKHHKDILTNADCYLVIELGKIK